MLWRDVRYAGKLLLRSRGFAAVSLLTLCLGIGANAVMFSLIQAVLLRPLPFAAPERLVWIASQFANGTQGPLSVPDFLDYDERVTSISPMAGYMTASVNLARGEAERVRALRVTGDFFPVLQVDAMVGRTLQAADTTQDASAVAVLSYQLWQRRFGGDRNCIGQSVTFDGAVFTVVGVMPETFAFPQSAPADIWVPLVFSTADRANRRNNMLAVIGRLHDGRTADEAQQEMALAASRLAQDYPTTNRQKRVKVTPLHEQEFGRTRPAFVVLLGAVSFVLLIACANVAMLLLSRAAVRQREIAIRAALGASRAQIIRQLVTETVLLWTVACAVGLAVAWASLPIVRRLAPASVPRLDEAHLDWRVLAFSFGITFLTGVVFGLVPAWRVSRVDLRSTIAASTPGGGGGRRQFVSAVLVVGEVALALLLAVGAGLMVQSFIRLRALELGFVSHQLVTMRVWPSPSAYSPQWGWSRSVAPRADGTRRPVTQLYRGIVDTVSTIPGVTSVGMVSSLPLDGGVTSGPFVVLGHESSAADTLVSYRLVTHTYFRTLGVPLTQGRLFTADDIEGKQRVVVISAGLARRYFGEADPIGQRVTVMGESREIVGVVGDVRRVIAEEPMPVAYLPVMQEPWPYMTLVLRTSLTPAALLPSLRQKLQPLDPNLPVYDVRTMEHIVEQASSQPRFHSALLGTFAAMAMAIAVIGIYGVISHWASRRTRELAIRMAVGATRFDVLWLVLKRGMTLAAIGIVVGLVAAYTMTKVMTSMLYQVAPRDLPTLLAASTLLLGVSALASFVPAWRAARIDPLVGLRES